eukprot:10103417-Heterocapsa_arctica.AAC.1
MQSQGNFCATGENEHWNTWAINPDADAAVMHPHDTQNEPWDDDWKSPNFDFAIEPAAEIANPVSFFEARLSSLTNLCWGPGNQRNRSKEKHNNHI